MTRDLYLPLWPDPRPIPTTFSTTRDLYLPLFRPPATYTYHLEADFWAEICG